MPYPVNAPILVNKTALLAKAEATYDTMPSMSGTSDSFLIEDVSFDPDFQMVERKFLKPTLSQNPFGIGRKLAKLKFTLEIAGNNKSNSGVLGDAPRWARFLKASGMQETAKAAAFSSPVLKTGISAFGPDVAWATSGTLSPTSPVGYFITVSTGGATGTAKFNISPIDTDLDSNQVNVTAATTVATAIGTKGLMATPTWTGSLVAGQQWFVMLHPPGIEYRPDSSAEGSMAFQLYYDGVLHQMTGSIGTFSMKGDAGDYGRVTFEFVGRYVDTVDANLPSLVYENQPTPPIFENARLNLGRFQPVFNSFSFDAGIKVSPRSSANHPSGHYGHRIVERKPTGGFDPEATNTSDNNLWYEYAYNYVMPFTVRFGNAPGNRLSFWSGGAQVARMPYRDRENMRAHDVSLQFSSLTGAGDDEFYLYVS